MHNLQEPHHHDLPGGATKSIFVDHSSAELFFDADASQICGTLVTFQYPFQSHLPFTSLNLSKVILTAQAQSRTEN